MVLDIAGSQQCTQRQEYGCRSARPREPVPHRYPSWSDTEFVLAIGPLKPVTSRQFGHRVVPGRIPVRLEPSTTRYRIHTHGEAGSTAPG
jgi:hypothetical protein